jgi:hypothetical protein
VEIAHRRPECLHDLLHLELPPEPRDRLLLELPPEPRDRLLLELPLDRHDQLLLEHPCPLLLLELPKLLPV